ncbi:hypothetical protein KY290_004968 [Solanum tuberosum]|uniref:Uncharacterized protein n=1 Tax=Solanum tuberosum TaxID=4113 RepID=A0ABQ7WCR6_SOLTU|nr:hypothetical protein KY290_004968 [Solanum tuberosum]
MISSLPLQPPPLPLSSPSTPARHRDTIALSGETSVPPLLSSLPSLPFPLLLSARTTPPASSVTATTATGGEQAVTRPPPISKLQQTSNVVTTKTKHFDRDGSLQICPRWVVLFIGVLPYLEFLYK